MLESLNNPGINLPREHQEAKALLAVLRREQQMLINADATGILALLDEKSQIVARAAGLALARHDALAAAGFEANEAGMRAWIEQLPAGNGALQQWTALLEVVREAKELNRINGMLVNQQLTRNEAALTVLHGGDQSGGLYGPNGQARVHTSSRSRIIG